MLLRDWVWMRRVAKIKGIAEVIVRLSYATGLRIQKSMAEELVTVRTPKMLKRSCTSLVRSDMQDDLWHCPAPHLG